MCAVGLFGLDAGVRLWLNWSRIVSEEASAANSAQDEAALFGRRPPVRRVVDVQPDPDIVNRLPMSRRQPVITAGVAADDIAARTGGASLDVTMESAVEEALEGGMETQPGAAVLVPGAGPSMHQHSGMFTAVSVRAQALTAQKLHPRRALTMRYKSQVRAGCETGAWLPHCIAFCLFMLLLCFPSILSL